MEGAFPVDILETVWDRFVLLVRSLSGHHPNHFNDQLDLTVDYWWYAFWHERHDWISADKLIRSFISFQPICWSIFCVFVSISYHNIAIIVAGSIRYFFVPFCFTKCNKKEKREKNIRWNILMLFSWIKFEQKAGSFIIKWINRSNWRPLSLCFSSPFLNTHFGVLLTMTRLGYSNANHDEHDRCSLINKWKMCYISGPAHGPGPVSQCTQTRARDRYKTIR